MLRHVVTDMKQEKLGDCKRVV